MTTVYVPDLILSRSLNISEYSHMKILKMATFRYDSVSNRPRVVTLDIVRRFKATVHDDVIKWKHFPRYWPFVRGIHRSPVNSPQKGQWRGALMFSLICVWINGWANNREAGDLRRYCAHYDVTVMKVFSETLPWSTSVLGWPVPVLNSLRPSDVYMCRKTYHHWFM